VGLGCGRPPLAGDPESPATPAPLRPWNGESTGSVFSESALRPTFQWAAVAGATEYELDVDDACPTEGFASCRISTPRLAARAITATSFRPSMPLDVDTSPPVGRRYFWRVRACNDHNCSPWSAIRYVNVGRQAQDFDGDGYADLLISSPGAGQALLYSGGPRSGDASSLSLDFHRDGQYMFQATWAGDVNGDGYGDIIGGSPSLDGQSVRPTLRFGRSASGLQPDDQVFDPNEAGEQLGFPLSGAGDMDADGFADVAFGWGHPSGEGANNRRGVVVYRGGLAMDAVPDLTYVEPEPDPGGSLSAAGDLDGDGYADLAIGARSGASGLGRVDVVWGSARLSALDGTTLTGKIAGAVWGQASRAGDLNGDGYADLVVGAPGTFPSSGQGGVTVIFGDSGRLLRAQVSIAGPQAFDFFGYSVSARSDLDGDGYSDLVVGAPLTDDSLGAVYLYRGGPSLSTVAEVVSRGTVAGGQFGRSVAGAGDLDGDGFPELAVGAPAVYSVTPGVFGRVYVYPGAEPSLTSSPLVLTREQTGDYFGAPVAEAPP
jgi:hypothetical protein